MTVGESIDALRELAMYWPHDDSPWEDRPVFRLPPAEDAVRDYENLGGFRLPNDLRTFFSEVDAIVAMSVHNGYCIGGVEGLSQSIRQGYYPSLVDHLPVVPIATDGGGNAFLIDATGRVWRWFMKTVR